MKITNDIESNAPPEIEQATPTITNSKSHSSSDSKNGTSEFPSTILQETENEYAANQTVNINIPRQDYVSLSPNNEIIKTDGLLPDFIRYDDIEDHLSLLWST